MKGDPRCCGRERCQHRNNLITPITGGRITPLRRCRCRCPLSGYTKRHSQWTFICAIKPNFIHTWFRPSTSCHFAVAQMTVQESQQRKYLVSFFRRLVLTRLPRRAANIVPPPHHSPPVDLRRMTSNSTLLTPSHREHRLSSHASQLLQTGIPRLGSRSPSSIPSSPTSA